MAKSLRENSQGAAGKDNDNRVDIQENQENEKYHGDDDFEEMLERHFAHTDNGAHEKCRDGRGRSFEEVLHGCKLPELHEEYGDHKKRDI